MPEQMGPCNICGSALHSNDYHKHEEAMLATQRTEVADPSIGPACVMCGHPTRRMGNCFTCINCGHPSSCS